MSKKKIARTRTTTKRAKKTPAKENGAFERLSAALKTGAGLDPTSEEWTLASQMRAKLSQMQRDGAPSYDERIKRMTGEQLAAEALEGYGDGPIAYTALLTLSGELDVLCDAADDTGLKLSLFAAARRARIAAELDRRAAQRAVTS